MFPGGTVQMVAKAKDAHDQIFNRLWTGNSAGSLAAIGALGSGKITDTKLLLLALSSFLVGVFALGIGSFVSLIANHGAITDRETTGGLLDVKVQPSDKTAPRLGFQNVVAICSALAFVTGIACGFALAMSGFWQ